MVAAVRRIGCDPVCKRCVRNLDHVRTTTYFAGWWVCSRCGEWLTELDEASWVR
jgi:ribosomal protein L37AE/L43A